MPDKDAFKDMVLIVWLLLATLWDIIVLGFCSYIVFWKHYSGFWFILGVLLCLQPTLFKALRKRFAVPEDDIDA